jgi:hypothetical protein
MVEEQDVRILPDPPGPNDEPPEQVALLDLKLKLPLGQVEINSLAKIESRFPPTPYVYRIVGTEHAYEDRATIPPGCEFHFCSSS